MNMHIQKILTWSLPLLHLALCCPRKFGPLHPLTSLDLVFFIILPSRSMILNMMYPCDFRSLICDLRSCSSPLSLLSNATGLSRFGFFKAKLCLISHNDLIMDQFNKANLYDMPRVTVSSFGSKIDTQKTKVRALSATFYRISIFFSEREL